MAHRTVYLAGPISGLTFDGAAGWRELARGRLRLAGISALDPMRWEYRPENGGPMPMRPESTPPREILARDLSDIGLADAILVNLLGAQRVSIGTVVELGVAKALRKPVVLVMEDRGNPHDHPFVTEVAAFWVHSLASGLDVVETLLPGVYQ